MRVHEAARKNGFDEHEAWLSCEWIGGSELGLADGSELDKGDFMHACAPPRHAAAVVSVW